MPKQKIALYPGSFDPCTNGHIDIVKRSLKIFDRVIICVMQNTSKKYWFNQNERIEMLKKTFQNNDKIEIKGFDGLLVDFAKKNNSIIVIRGIRNAIDFEYEKQMEFFNKKLSENKLESVFLFSALKYQNLSSSFLKEIAIYNGKIDDYVTYEILEKIKKKVSEIPNYFIPN